MLFPNAQFYIAESDLNYWTDYDKAGPKLKDFVDHAKKNLTPVRDRLVFYKDDQEFLPGIHALAAPGHTVGHTIFVISSGGKSFCYTADLTHHPILLMEKPRMEFSFDTDPKQAAGSRVKMLDMLAANKMPVLAYHYPWPGIGHIAKTAEGFHYIPEPMQHEDVRRQTFGERHYRSPKAYPSAGLKSASVGVGISKRSRMVEQVLPPSRAMASSLAGSIRIRSTSMTSEW